MAQILLPTGAAADTPALNYVTVYVKSSDKKLYTKDDAGLETALGGGSGTVTGVTGTAPIASSGGTTPAISLNDTAVTPGSYTLASITVDAKGRLTSASSGSAGVGDVVGPASSVNNQVTFFDGTTGKLIKDSGLTLSGTNTGDQTTVSGNAGTATALATPRAINGTDFDGTAAITITAAGSTLTGTVVGSATSTSLNSTILASSLTSVGTITSGVWNGTTVAVANGGTGQTTASAAFNALSPMTTGGDIIFGGASGAGTRLANGSAAQVLQSNGTTLAPTWVTLAAGASLDANNNFSADSFIQGYAATATAGGANTLALTVDSVGTQFFTGTTTHAVTLPAANTLVNGQTFRIVNNSTGIVTVNASSGANTVAAMAAGTEIWLTCIDATVATAAGWNFRNAVSAGRNITAPNATIPVHHLSAIGSEADIDVALVPKGTGSVTAQIADNGTGGGNKRGINSVDWQTSRDGATQVASGTYSVVGGGRYCRASGNFSVVAGGSDCKATGANGVVSGGSANTATSSAVVAGGTANNASSSESTVGGGTGNTASGFYATIPGGYRAHTQGIAGKYAYSSGSFSGTASGDAQYGNLTLRGLTISTTAVVLTSDAAAGSLTNQLILQANQAMMVRGLVVARKKVSEADQAAAWEFTCVIRRGATGAAPVMIGTPTVSLIASDITSIVAGDLVVTASATANAGLVVTVTGITSVNIRWLCTLITSEVIFA